MANDDDDYDWDLDDFMLEDDHDYSKPLHPLNFYDEIKLSLVCIAIVSFLSYYKTLKGNVIWTEFLINCGVAILLVFLFGYCSRLVLGQGKGTAVNKNITRATSEIFMGGTNLKEADRFSEVDPSASEATIQEHASADTFTGNGYTLNSGSGTPSETSSGGGIGGWLGSLIGSVTGSGSSSSTSVNTENEKLNQQSENRAREMFSVDNQVPTCKIQVRLLDGKKMSVTLNNSLTVEQLREYITIARPSLAEIEFAIYTGHPAKVIEDESVTLEDANLAKAVVVLQVRK